MPHAYLDALREVSDELSRLAEFLQRVEPPTEPERKERIQEVAVQLALLSALTESLEVGIRTHAAEQVLRPH